MSAGAAKRNVLEPRPAQAGTHRAAPTGRLRPPSWISLRTLFAMLVVVVPLSSVGAVGVLQALKAYRAVEVERLRSTSHALATAVEAQLSAYAAAAVTLSRLPLFADAQYSNGVTAEVLEDRVRGAASALGVHIALLAPTAEAPLLASTQRRPGATLPTRRSDQAQAGLGPVVARVLETGRGSVSDLFRGDLRQDYVFVVAEPVRQNGEIVAIVGLVVDYAAVQAILAPQILPRRGFAAAADGTLRIIGHTNFPPGAVTGRAVPDWVAGAIAGQESTIVTGVGWSGEMNLYATTRVRSAPGWTVTVAEPLSDVDAAAWHALRPVVLGLGALGVGLFAAAWLLRRERVHAAEEESARLRAARDETRRVLAGLPSVIFQREVEPDGTSRLTARSGDVAAVTGWPAEMLLTRDSWTDFVEKGSRDYRSFNTELLRRGEAVLDWRMRQPDGSHSAMRTYATVLTRRPDGGAEVVGLIQNVQRERTAEASAIAAARLASLGEMAAGLGHELKQPLQVMSLAAENALRGLGRGETARVAERLQRIVYQAERAGKIIEQLRRFSRGPEQGATIGPVPLDKAVADALTLSGAALEAAGIELQSEPGTPPLVVAADEIALEHVLVNLLSNARDALEATPPGHRRLIRIAAVPAPDAQVEITVSDTGGGIPEHLLGRVFEPFVTTKGPDKGTGLGLPICHGLMRAMGGRIEARNGPDGAVFTLHLRAATPEQHAGP